MSQDSSPESLRDFGPAYALEPPLEERGFLISAGITLDRQDRIHMVWSTVTGLTGYAFVDFPGAGGTDLLWQNPGTKSPGALVLADEYSRIGDIARAADGSVWFTWTESISDRQASIQLGRVHDGGLSSWRIAHGDGLFPASLFLDGQERFHLGWHDIYEESYYASGRLDQLDDPKAARVVRLQSRAFQPILTRTQGRTLAVYEDTYSHLMTVLPEEAPPRAVPLTRSRPRFAWHTFHSPQFALDRYGIAWLFFVDSARQHVFRTRWLGQGWGPVHNTAKLIRNSPRMEDNHLSIERLAVETGMGEGEPGIKILVTHGDQQALRSVPVPSLAASPGKKVLFLDLAEVQALENLRLRVNPARKHAGNPVIQAGAEEGDPDVHGAGNFLRVLKEENVYRMWYSTMRRDRSRPWWEWYGVGYAESRDGYHFRKKELVRNTPYVPMVLKDANARNPNRRYKLLKFPTHGSRAQEARAGRYNPWQETNAGTLSVSRDGIDWIPEPAIMFFPGGRPFSLMPQSVLYDPEERDPDKRYKAYGFSALNLARRGGGYAYSPDAYHWTAHPDNPMLDPFARAIPVVRGRQGGTDSRLGGLEGRRLLPLSLPISAQRPGAGPGTGVQPRRRELRLRRPGAESGAVRPSRGLGLRPYRSLSAPGGRSGDQGLLRSHLRRGHSWRKTLGWSRGPEARRLHSPRTGRSREGCGVDHDPGEPGRGVPPPGQCGLWRRRLPSGRVAGCREWDAAPRLHPFRQRPVSERCRIPPDELDRRQASIRPRPKVSGALSSCRVQRISKTLLLQLQVDLPESGFVIRPGQKMGLVSLPA